MKSKQKEKSKIISKDKDNNSSYNFNECYEKLLNEVKNFKAKNFKKESNKIIKTIYFTKYIESIDYSLGNSKISFLWSNHIFLEQFISELELYPEFEEPAIRITEILCGNFSNAIKKKKMLKYIIDFEYEPNIYLTQQLCSFYSIQLSKNNLRILFSICLKNDENCNSKTASAYIYFISITEEQNLEKSGLTFIKDYILKYSDDFPLIQFDKSGLFMSKELLANYRKDKDGNLEIYFPVKHLSTENRTIFKTEIINKKIIHHKNNAEDFKTNEINNLIIEQIENDECEQIIKDAINGKFWGDIKLSKQEKDKIFPSQPFIISGRPGTGKTTVILVKLFSIYYNFYLKKKKLKENANYNKNEEEKLFNSQLRVVFTSFSQELCKEQMKSFNLMVKNVKELEYKPIAEKELRNISSFRDIKDYPIFVNFRKIMFMIDGSLTFQFFKRKDLRIFENPDDSVFYYDEEKQYECNNYYILSEENFKNNFINYFYRSPELDKDIPIVHLYESNEDTFSKFYNNYLNNGTDLAKKLLELKLNSIEVYAQYISIIKGSFTSHLYPTNCISLEEYQKKGKKITDSLCLEVVYEICMEYENFKRKSNMFDIQDLTNFLIRQVLIELNDIKLIDYLFIDEIQDLTVSQIFLLILVSKHVKIYAGDTCQTISKINRFRFSELNNIFYNFQKVLPNFDSVNEAYLSLNYRLNSKIMILSTYMAYFMRQCFPNTLDKFQDDFSIKITDHLPMLIIDDYNSQNDSIFSIFNKDKTESDLIKNLTLSSNHCFICRGKKTKQELKKKNVLPRTIEESKGLEYDIVVVYNFFSESPFYSLWDKLFRDDNLNEFSEKRNSSVIELENLLTKEDLVKLIKSLRLDQYYQGMKDEEIKEKILKDVKNLKYPSLKGDFDIHSNFDFCSELKQFYVLITRPRTFLLFYEEKDSSKFSFFKRMIQNQIIKKVKNTDEVNYIDEIMNYYEKNEMLCRTKLEMKEFAERKMMEEKYEDAAYFFGKAGETSLQNKALIYLYYKKIKEDKRNHKMTVDEFRELNQEIIDKINELKSEPDIFQDYDNIEPFCYFNLEEYDIALEIYKDKKKFNEVGEIYLQKKYDYEKAFEYFKLANNISNAIKSLLKSDKRGHFLKLFEYINDSNICFKLGLSEYYNIYQKYINDLFISVYTKKRYIRNIFNIAKKEDDEKEKEEEKEEEKKNELNNEIEKNEDNKEKNNINIKIDENNINNNPEKEINNNAKRKKKSGKRRRIYGKKRNRSPNSDEKDEEKNNNEEENEENNKNEENNEINENEINKENKEGNEKDKIWDNKENTEDEENNQNDENEENKKIQKNEKNQNNTKKEESLKTIKDEEELSKSQKLNFIIYEAVDIIKGRVNDYIFNSIFSSLPIEEKGIFFVDYVFEKVIKKNKKLTSLEEENLEIEESNIKVKELKEKRIVLNINDDISKENCFEFNCMDNQKLIEIKNTNIFKNNPKSKTNKEIIMEIIGNYYRNINMFDDIKSQQNYSFNFSYNDYIYNFYNYQINVTKYHINQFKEEFKLSNKINEFLECYYSNTKEYLMNEIIKCMPEIYYYKSFEFKKSSKNVKDLLVKAKETNDKIYENISKITKFFLYKTDLLQKEINKFFYPLFYLNNFYDISQACFSNDLLNQKKTEILLNITLNNINKNYEKENINILMDINYILYYLNYKLRYCLTIFIKTKEFLFETEEPFITYNFRRLKELVKNIKNKKYLICNKLNNDDIVKLVTNIKEKNIFCNNNNISEIIELFDITSYISLYLLQLYIDDASTVNNFDELIEENPSEYYNTIYNLYKFSLIFNEINNDSSNDKKLLIFSLFNIFGVNPIPNIPIFTTYKTVNCCLLNKNSVLFNKSFEGTHLDFFSDKNDFLYSSNNEKIISIFDSNGNNIILSNDILYRVFRLLLSKYVNILFEKNKSILIEPHDPFKEKKNEDEVLYYELIYYFNLLDYKIIKDEESIYKTDENNENNENKNNLYISNFIFWKNIIKNCKDSFRGYKTLYPFYFIENKYNFSLNNYLLELFFNKVNSPQVLLSFINEYNYRISSDEFPENDFCFNEMYILFNFIQIYFPKYDFKQYKNDLFLEVLNIKKIGIDYNEILEIFSCIQHQKPSLLISILFLRLLLPYILNIISNIRNIDINIYSLKSEQIFNNKVKFLELDFEEEEESEEKELTIIKEYLNCIKGLLWFFSLNGKYYSNYLEEIKYYRQKNFVEYRNETFYKYGINKINREKTKYKESLDILEYAFEKNYKLIKINYNWYFHFYEILFNCFYLTFIDCANKLEAEDNLSNIINYFLNFYEEYDYYLNFIDSFILY